ncbi:GntR family transcriptional regulator [Oribacterium sp. oral taxon 102]|uniref:GntR family transcriptional regulator n=1 Tax=Oribacterium sp. oral taxon 102 TaxID=671214 RepID=UPI0015B9DA3E|nr:GntR family transcriptional regulator [Oribacterium sp. oral taxon 102]NWO20536.1 GntR family transcriptional regulator [Oribacterium sp. oral taxon 102]
MTLRDKVYQNLYRDITDGLISQGEIITENDLGSRFSVSKAPVREALGQLCREGILQSLPRLGYQVRTISLKEIADIIETRVDLEVSGLRRLEAGMSDEQRKAFDTLWNSAFTFSEERNAKDISGDWANNYSFHRGLYALNRNECGYAIVDSLIHKSSLYISQYYLAAWGEKRPITDALHKEILGAVRTGDFDTACKKLALDIRKPKQDIIKMHEM